jgi:tetratricopeptide (TPR) repeat protein
MGRYDEAEPLFRQALEIGEKTIGTAHPEYATHLNNLAGLLKDMGRIEEARPLLDEAVAIWRKSLGEDHPTYATGLWWKADFAGAEGDWDAARGDYSAAYAVFVRVMGEDHPDTKELAGQYARLLLAEFPDDPALAELESAFGADIGR